MPNLVKATQYSEPFEYTWQRKPKRHIPDNKKAAYRAWCTRLKQGYTERQMAIGVKYYGKALAAQNRLGTEYVKMLSTFFGPDEHFMQYQEEVKPEPPKPTTPARAREQHKAISLMDQLDDRSWAL